MVKTEFETCDLPNFTPKTEREEHIVNKLGDKYRFIKRLGQSSTSAVYAVKNSSLGRVEALKVFLSDLMWDSEFLERFKIEARICASFRHPNIVTIYNYDKLNGFYFFSMLFVDGPTLNDYIKPGASMSVPRICTKMATICDAVGYAHQRGVIHRDVKAANIMLDQSGTPYVADFGIAKCEMHQTQTQSGALMGTPHYVSPEQVEGLKIDGRADIYALGVTLYALLTRKYPFQGHSCMSIISKRLTQKPIPPETFRPDLHPRLGEIIHKSLQADRRDRYQTTAELARDLTEFARHSKQNKASGSPSSTDPKQAFPVPKWSRSIWKWLVPAVLVAAMPLLFMVANEGPLLPGKVQHPPDRSQSRHDTDSGRGFHKIKAPRMPESPKPDERLNRFVADMERKFEEGDHTGCLNVAAAAKSLMAGLPADQRGAYSHFQDQIDAYEAKSNAAIESRRQQLAKLDKIDASIAAGQLDEAVRLIDAMSARNDLAPDFLSNLSARRDTIQKKRKARMRVKNRKRQLSQVKEIDTRIAEGRLDEAARRNEAVLAQKDIDPDVLGRLRAQHVVIKQKQAEKAQAKHTDNELKRWTDRAELKFKEKNYSACLNAVASVRAILDRLPDQMKASYSHIREKMDRIQSKVETAVQSKKRQFADLEIIKKKVANGHLDEAILLIDAMLVQTDLSPEIQNMLRSQRKIIKRISEE